MRPLAAIALVLPLLAACGAGEPPPDDRKKSKGRAETQAIRNTERIGYSGDAIGDQVDATLDAAEARQRQMEEAEQAAETP